MRIANKTLTDRFANNVNTTLDLINKYNNEIATGKKIATPSDAPDDISLVLQFKRSLANIEQYGKNIDSGISFLRATNDALIASVEQGRIARQLTVNAANDPSLFSDSAITGLITDIQGIKEEIMAQANTELSGKFIFSGYSTKTAAYGTSSNGYRGDTFNIMAKTSDNNTVATNVTGDVAFRETEIIGNITGLDVNDPADTILIGGITERYDNIRITEDKGKLVTSLPSPPNTTPITYTGSETRNYRIIVTAANTTAGQVGGLDLSLEYTNGSVDANGDLIYNNIETINAVGGIASTETFTFAATDGLTFEVDVDLEDATNTLEVWDPANITNPGDMVNSYDVTGDVAFTVSDGTNTSQVILFSAGNTYNATQIKNIIDAAIAGGSPQAPTISFDYDSEGRPVFSIDPKDVTGTMEFVDLSVGTNDSSRGSLRDMFSITEGFKNIFGVLDDLINAIENKSHEDVELILSRLDNVEGEMLKNTGIVGARERSLSNNQQFLQKVKDEKVSLLANLEDADPAESITRLTNQMTMYDAILYYGSLIQRRSLLDFLR